MRRLLRTIVVGLGLVVAGSSLARGAPEVASQVSGRVKEFSPGGLHSELENFVDVELSNHSAQTCTIKRMTVHGPRGSEELKPKELVVAPHATVAHHAKLHSLIAVPGEQGVVQVWEVSCK